MDSVEGWHPDLDISSEMEGSSRHALNSQSVSATNGLAALRINTPNSFRPSTETARRSTVSRDTTTDERNVLNTSNITPESPLSTFSPSTPDSLSPLPPLPVNSKTSYLTLPTADASFDAFNVNIDFTQFETKLDIPIRHESPPKRITNHDFIFLVDDGPGIDHRAWDTICDIVSGVAKRLIPLTAKDLTTTTITTQFAPISDVPPEAPSISLRFINNPRHISRIQNLAQIRNLFNWVSPRESHKYYNSNRMSHHIPIAAQKSSLASIPPLRTLEYHFWNVYNEKLQKNAWVGQTPTTIILFSSSPVGKRPEDTDVFVAKCAEKLNDDQVPLPLVSIMLVQCNADGALQRQLAETRRSITGEWYTPRTPKQATLPPAAVGNARSPRRSMLNPYIPEPRRRPQRDWVDIITCVDWERVGGFGAIKGMIEEEIQRGTARRRRLQREVAMNYLTHLGKESTATSTATTATMTTPFRVPEPIPRVVEPIDVAEYEVPSRENSWDGGQEEDRGGMVPNQRDWSMDTDKGGDYSDYRQHHQRGTASLGVIHTGRIDYYD